MNLTSTFAPDLFAGHTVFITGGGSGINLGIAKSFAALGARIAICGRSRERLDAAAATLRNRGAEVVAEAADVRDYDALARAIDLAGERLGPIDVLVAGAAGNFAAPAEAISTNGFKTVVEIDLLGAFNAARAAFEQLKQTRGALLFVSAGQSLHPYALQAHVGAAKAGIDNLMRTLALEWGPHSIRANSIVPGWTADTEGVKRLAPPGSEGKLSQHIPLRRMGTVEDVGAVACLLASPLAAYVTGTTVMADGGANLPGSGIWAQLIGEMTAGG